MCDSGLGVEREVKPFGFREPEIGRKKKRKLSSMKPEPCVQVVCAHQAPGLGPSGGCVEGVRAVGGQTPGLKFPASPPANQ